MTDDVQVRSGSWDGRRKKTWLFRGLLVSDLTCIFIAGVLATIAKFGSFPGPLWKIVGTYRLSYELLVLLAVAVWPIFMRGERLYELRTLFWGAGEFKRSVKAVTFGAWSFVFVGFALKVQTVSRLWAFFFWVFAMVTVVMGRAVVRATLTFLRRRGRFFERTLLVGTNANAAHLLDIITSSPQTGLRVAGYLARDSEAPSEGEPPPLEGAPYLGKTSEIVEIVREKRIDTVLVVTSAFNHDEVSELLAMLRGLDVDVDVSAGIFEVLAARMRMRELAGIPLLLVRGAPLSRRRAAVKRAFDVVVATLIALVGLPLWLVVMAAIKLDSPGPVFYRQPRVGKAGIDFGMFKFRSMHSAADAMLDDLLEQNEASGPLFKIRDDPRITRVGRVLRRYSLDEFPQILNVLLGDMSLVGPRPPLPSEVDEYSEHDWRRLEVLPGMTGLWQVSGRSDLTFEEMIRLDLFYIENWSFGLDGTILLRTIPTVLFPKGAY